MLSVTGTLACGHFSIIRQKLNYTSIEECHTATHSYDLLSLKISQETIFIEIKLTGHLINARRGGGEYCLKDLRSLKAKFNLLMLPN